MPEEQTLSNPTGELVCRSGKRELLVTALLALLTTCLYLPILWRMVTAYDYIFHLNAARKFAEKGAIATPHILFHALTAAVSRLFGTEIATAGLVVLLLCIAATVLVIYRIWLRTLDFPLSGKLLLAATLLFVAPITLLYPVDHHLYFGYIGINVFHNPTMLVLKPISLLLFGFAGYIFPHEENARRQKSLLVSLPVIVIACSLAKPSYLICFLPALTLFTLARAALKKKIDWVLFLGCILLPALLVLSLQYYLTYSTSQLAGFYGGKSSVVFAPFLVAGLLSGWLLPKLFLSIAFPLTVLLLYWRAASRNNLFLLAWLTFGIGAFQSYFLMESGPRAYQGNFLWSGQIANFVLFVVSSAHCLKNAGPLKSGRRWNVRLLCCIGIFVLHLVAGIIYYCAEFSQTERYW